MARTLAILLLLLVGKIAAISGFKFDGTYELQTFVDEAGSAVAIPAATTLVLAGESNRRYHIKVTLKKGQARGNTLIGNALIRPATGATTAGPITSTRMRTPFLEYESELAEALGAATSTTLSSAGSLVMKGAGQVAMTFSKVSS